MDWETVLLFSLTVLPLICTPGPGILFTASQGLSSGRRAALRAVMGVLLGYTVHAVLSAFGVAALVVASPLLFALLKWAGVVYLGFLAFQMLRSAFTPGGGVEFDVATPVSLWRGFLTSFLNPKGLLMYLAVLPQFIEPGGSAALQALVLSLLFIVGCAIVYSVVGLLAAQAANRGVTDRSRRWLEAVAGTLLATAAARMASQQ